MGQWCVDRLPWIGVLTQNHRARALYLRSGFAEMHVTLEKGLR